MKLPVSLSEVSTARRIAPDNSEGYRAKLEVKDEKTEDGKDMLVLSCTITEDDEAVKGITMYENFVWFTKKNEPNKAAMTQFKRHVENILGEERANDPEFDSTELNELDCRVLTLIDSYENKQHETVPINRIRRLLPA